MSNELQQKRIAILATDGFEQSELEQPLKAYREAGAHCEIVSLQSGSIQGMNHHDKADQFPVDKPWIRCQPVTTTR